MSEYASIRVHKETKKRVKVEAAKHEMTHDQFINHLLRLGMEAETLLSSGEIDWDWALSPEGESEHG